MIYFKAIYTHNPTAVDQSPNSYRDRFEPKRGSLTAEGHSRD